MKKGNCSIKAQKKVLGRKKETIVRQQNESIKCCSCKHQSIIQWPNQRNSHQHTERRCLLTVSTMNEVPQLSLNAPRARHRNINHPIPLLYGLAPRRPWTQTSLQFRTRRRARRPPGRARGDLSPRSAPSPFKKMKQNPWKYHRSRNCNTAQPILIAKQAGVACA